MSKGFPASMWAPRPPLEMTPTEFEQFVCNLLLHSGWNGIRPISVKHNAPVRGRGGSYRIDGKMTYVDEAGVRRQALIECKRVRSSVKRQIVEQIVTRTESLGMDKGIIFSTATFQSGARKLARATRIATIVVMPSGQIQQITPKAAVRLPQPFVPLDPIVGVMLCSTIDGICGSVITGKWMQPFKEWIEKGV